MLQKEWEWIRELGRLFKCGHWLRGSCFPKDTKALVQIAGNVAHDFRLLKAVIEVNNKQQLLLIEKAKKVINMNKKRIAVLGAAFKPNTDDIREAPSLIMIQELMNIGADIVLYDPKAIQNMKNIFGRLYNIANV